MKDFFVRNKEFAGSVLAVFLGTATGFVAARFISEKLSDHAFRNCSSRNLVFVQEGLMGSKYICLKK